MSQSRVNLATARRELAERQDEVNLFTAELKAAQEVMAAGGTGPKTLTVTVKEIFGAITVDRVAVRPPNAPAQEKVIAETIPCRFTLDAGTDKFDLVLMAEHAAISAATNGQLAAATGAAAVTAAGSTPAVDGARAVADQADEVVISAADSAEAVEAEAGAVDEAAQAAAAVDAAGADGADAAELVEAPPTEQASVMGGMEVFGATVMEVIEEGVETSGDTTDTAATGTETDGTATVEELAEPAAAAAAAATATDVVEAKVDVLADAAEPAEPAADEMPSTEEAEVAGTEPAAGEEEAVASAEAAVEKEVGAPEGGDGVEGGGEEKAAALDVADVEEAEASPGAVTSTEPETAAPEVEVPVVAEEGDGTSAVADAGGAEEEARAAGAEGVDADGAVAAVTAAAAVMTEMTAETVAETALLETTNRDIATPAAAAVMGCSTATTEVVVPSSELNLKSSHGQWRYLEADSTPVHGDDAVEVTKGVRFSTSLESLDRREDENRVVELAMKLDEAEQRARSAQAMIKKLQPAPAGAGTSSRKKSPGGAGGRKSALKKGKGAGGTRAVKSDARKRKAAVSAVSAAVGSAFGKVKSAGAFAWGSRNLVFFVSAVAAMHFHGDYLAV